MVKVRKYLIHHFEKLTALNDKFKNFFHVFSLYNSRLKTSLNIWETHIFFPTRELDFLLKKFTRFMLTKQTYKKKMAEIIYGKQLGNRLKRNPLLVDTDERHMFKSW